MSAGVAVAYSAVYLSTEAAHEAAVRMRDGDQERALERIEAAIADLERAARALRGW